MELLISVCLCTYRRKEGVIKALQALGALKAPPISMIEIIVVDNDAEGSARAPVEFASQNSQWPVHYFIEPRSGVSHARNRCLVEASGVYVAFIDDDEWCDPDWIIHLHSTLVATGSTAAFGPIIPYFESRPPNWLLKSGVFNRPRFRSGTIIDWKNTRSGNVLIARDQVGIESKFSTEYASIGGEDTAFFLTLLRIMQDMFGAMKHQFMNQFQMIG